MCRYISGKYHRGAAATIVALLLLLFGAPLAPAVYAGGQVTDCSSETDFVNKLVGGGTVTFNCGSSPPPILISTIRTISQNTTIDGGGLITLSGGNSPPFFWVSGGVALTLTHISLVKGYNAFGDGGAIRNEGRLVINHSHLLHNQTGSDYSGGAIVTYGPLTISDSEFAFNKAGNGGAMYPRYAGAVTTITGSNIHDNVTTNATNGWGGALLLWDGAPVSITQTQLSNNVALNGGGAIYVQGPSSLTISGSQVYSNATTADLARGGGIYSEGATSVMSSSLYLNHAGRGGAVFVAAGTASLAGSDLTGNWATYLGGALNHAGGDLFVTQTSFDQNGYAGNGDSGVVTAEGGAVSTNSGNALLTSVTLSNNLAGSGGGIEHGGGASTLINVTLSGNFAVDGGGINQGGGVMTVTNSTLSGNAASSGSGGINSPTGAISLRNTIVANSRKGGNCNAPLASAAFSLSSDGTCGFGAGRDNVNVRLGPLANNGGATLTYLPLAGSPAIDGGTNSGCPATDQRGVTRPQGAACDVGSVEYRVGDTTPLLYLPMVER